MIPPGDPSRGEVGERPVIVMVFITGVFLLLQTNTIRSTAKVGQGEAEVTQADGEKKKRKVKIARNLKVI